MAKAAFHHSEAFLQWIWENLLFDFTNIKTTEGQPIELLRPGIQNVSDGPDFKQGRIQIDGITWHGDVEIHTQSRYWKTHGHHYDPAYNSIVLHVVAEDEPLPVQTENGSSPFTLNLLPYLSPELHRFLKNFEQPSGLPCTSALHFISEEAFYRQIEKAHHEYFEKKADDFLQFYDPELLPSQAWKKALIISLWDGLGISQNREPMRQTADRLLEQWVGNSPEAGLKLAIEIAGFGSMTSPLHSSWNFKSVRPANHPKNRIKEAVQLSSLILNEPFQTFLTPQAPEMWHTWMHHLPLKSSQRMEILFGTVFLPALFILGKLYAHQALAQSARSAWQQLQTPIPSNLLKKYNKMELSDRSYRKKLGAIHQLHSYCEHSRCSECFVLKKAITS